MQIISKSSWKGSASTNITTFPKHRSLSWGWLVY